MEAAKVAKSRVSPAVTVAVGFNVKFTGVEVKAQLPPAAQENDAFKTPEEDPVTLQVLVLIAWTVMSSFKALVSEVTMLVMVWALGPRVTVAAVAVEV